MNLYRVLSIKLDLNPIFLWVPIISQVSELESLYKILILFLINWLVRRGVVC